VLWAFVYTLFAVDAKMGFECYLCSCLPGFYVLAPDALQGTALEKNQAPNPRTIMKTEMLQGDYERLS